MVGVLVIDYLVGTIGTNDNDDDSSGVLDMAICS